MESERIIKNGGKFYKFFNKILLLKKKKLEIHYR